MKARIVKLGSANLGLGIVLGKLANSYGIWFYIPTLAIFLGYEGKGGKK